MPNLKNKKEIPASEMFPKARERLFPVFFLGGVLLSSLLIFIIVDLFRGQLYFVASASTYLLLHNIVEIFSVIISISIFIISWFTYRQARDARMIFLGCMFLGVGLLDIMHFFSFPGMPAFITPSSTNKGILFWLSARLVFSSALLVSAFIPRSSERSRFWKQGALTAALLISAAAFFGAIFYESSLPAMFIVGVGLTPLKIYLEYAVIGLLILAYIVYLGIFLKTRERIILFYLAALTISIFSELAFTLYKSAYDTFNMLGHVYKFIAFCFIYAGIFVVSIRWPYLQVSEMADKMKKDNVLLKKAEKAEQKAEKYANKIIGSANAMIVGLDTAGKVTVFNEMAEKITGYRKDEVAGKNWFELIVPRRRFPEVWKIFEEFQKKGKSIAGDFQNPILTKSGETRTIEWRNSDLRDNGNVIGTISFGIDITERKRAEELLKEERGLFIGGPTVVFKWKAAEGWPVEYVSPNVKDQFGYAQDETVSAKFRYASIVHPDDLARVGAEVDEYSKKGTASFEQEYRIRRKDGAYRWVDDFTTVIRNERGAITNYLGYVIDITERKLEEERLKELDRLKDDFLSVTTHELKTPLVPIKSQAQLLLAGDYGKINQKQKEAIEMIYRNGEMLNALSSEVLDIAKIKSNKFKLVLESTSLDKIITEAVGDMKIAAGQKHLDLSLLAIPKIPAMMIDGSRIRQVLANLLDNAIKFTPEDGRIRVTVKKAENEVTVLIKDSGIGLNAENLTKIFIPFFQVESSVNRKYRGTGLGLAVCKGIVEAHGGKIWAESSGDGKGSTFIFSLPIK